LQYSKSRDLEPSRPRLATIGLETSQETPSLASRNANFGGKTMINDIFLKNSRKYREIWQMFKSQVSV